MVGERGFEPPTPWSRKRDSGVVLNVFNLIQWCFDPLSPIQSSHSGVNVSPRMAAPDQGSDACRPDPSFLSAGRRTQIAMVIEYYRIFGCSNFSQKVLVVLVPSLLNQSPSHLQTSRVCPNLIQGMMR